MSKSRLSSTVEEFGSHLAIKGDLLDKISSVIDKLNDSKTEVFSKSFIYAVEFNIATDY